MEKSGNLKVFFKKSLRKYDMKFIKQLEKEKINIIEKFEKWLKKNR